MTAQSHFMTLTVWELFEVGYGMLSSCICSTLVSACAMKGIPIGPLAQWGKDLTYYLTPFFCLVNEICTTLVVHVEGHTCRRADYFTYIHVFFSKYSSPLSDESILHCRGFLHFGGGLAVGLNGLAAGFAIGIVGDSGVRGNAQQPRLFIGMILILIFAEVLGLYGLIIAVFFYADWTCVLALAINRRNYCTSRDVSFPTNSEYGYNVLLDAFVLLCAGQEKWR